MDVDALGVHTDADEVGATSTDLTGQSQYLAPLRGVDGVDRIVATDSGAHLNSNSDGAIKSYKVELAAAHCNIGGKHF